LSRENHQAARKRRRFSSILLYAVIIGGLLLLYLAYLIPIDSRITDLVVYFNAAERLRSGLPLYQDPNIATPLYEQYLYPPPIAIIFLAFPSLSSAWIGWLTVSLLFFGVALSIIITELRPTSLTTLPLLPYLALFAILIFPPLLHHLSWGQVQLFLLCLLTGVWYCLRHKHDKWAGLLLGLSIVIKLYPVIWLLPLFVQRRWWAMSMAIVSSIAITIASFSFVGWDQFGVFINQVMPAVSQDLGAELFRDNFSMRSTIYILTGNHTAAHSIDLLYRCIIVLAFIVVVWRAAKHRDSLTPLAMTTMIILSPIIWAHYFVLLYLSMIDTFANFRRQFLIPLWCVYIFISLAPLMRSFTGMTLIILHTLPALGLLVLFIVQSKIAVSRA